VGNSGTDDPSISNTWPNPPQRNGIFWDNLHVRITDVTDGTSNTWLILERYHVDPGFDSYTNDPANQGIDSYGEWTSDWYEGFIYPTVAVNYQMPQGRTGAQERAGFIKRLDSMGSGHPGGANAALADGSVRFVSNSMSVATLAAAATRSGGEVLGPEW
jgi:prepilin-type processing-associated H-X9-DG protein